jgi:N-acetylglucosamine-6-sulfatase
VGAGRPNIVFVLTDDLSMDLVRFMPHVQALESRGMTFENYFVSDSLCCPSRASIFTGSYPHDTGVFENVGPDGGIGAFYAHGDEQSTFNVALQRAGYRTAMMGKYLNGYLQGPLRSPVPGTYVPPGWDEWDVAGWGYPEYNYPLNENGRVRRFGHRPQDYLTNVLARKGVGFINRSAHSGKPFFLELATFAPHHPFTPARADIHDFPGLRAPEPPNFDALPSDPPRWLAGHRPLTPGQLTRIDQAFRRRAQAVQSVDRMIGRIETALGAHRIVRNTYIVFSSDNGLHTGEYRLMPGKLTAFDTDIRVPLVVAGPAIPPGATTGAVAGNIDLAKTFTAIGGTTLPGDGHSLVPLLNATATGDWRNAMLIEHHGPAVDITDPDAQSGTSGNPTTYEAMRTPRFLYVEYADGEREFYDLERDPYELDNAAGTLTQAQLTRLHRALTALEDCHTGPDCWTAEHVAPLP